MAINWAGFTPWSAFAGGLMIGVAAAMLLLLNGRIAGISGIVGGLFKWRPEGVAWRVAFIAGIVLSPWAYRAVAGEVSVTVQGSVPLLVIAGLLVGLGTRYGSGCTSGHGVCGIARGSMRSIVATCVFMLTGMVTVFVIRHVL